MRTNVSPSFGEIIRKLKRREAVKWLARQCGVPFSTARNWIYVDLSEGRQKEVAEGVLAEIDRQIAERMRWRSEIVQWRSQIITMDLDESHEIGGQMARHLAGAPVRGLGAA